MMAVFNDTGKHGQRGIACSYCCSFSSNFIEANRSTRDTWNKNQLHYPLPGEILTRIEKHMKACKK